MPFLAICAIILTTFKGGKDMENSFVEYKRELTDGLEKEVVAFLNALGGEIHIGVDNHGEVLG